MKESTEVLNVQAIKLASKGEYKEAIACIKRALTMQNKNHFLWYNLGITYRDAGNLSQAKESLLTAHKLAPSDEDTIETLAHICFLQSNYEEALSFCNAGLSVNDLNPRFWNNCGVIHFTRGEYEDACEAFEKAVTIDPYYYDALYNLRDTYEELGNTNGTLECVNRLRSLPNGDKHA